MANPIKDIAGMIGAKIQRASVNSRLSRYLNDKIGPEGVVGMKNQSTNYKRISRLVDQDKQPEAAAYAKDQKEKVDAEVFEERQAKQQRYRRAGY